MMIYFHDESLFVKKFHCEFLFYLLRFCATFFSFLSDHFLSSYLCLGILYLKADRCAPQVEVVLLRELMMIYFHDESLFVKKFHCEFLYYLLRFCATFFSFLFDHFLSS